MSERTPQPQKVIGNVGILDIRRATAASVAQVKRIGNVGLMLYAPETAALASLLPIGNLGSAVEVPADAQVLTGQVSFTRQTLAAQPRPLDLAVAGQLILDPDIAAADIDRGIASLVIAGQVVCPEHLAGVLQAKIREVSGRLQVYTGAVRPTIGVVTLDSSYLEGLEDGSTLVVIGSLRVPRVVPAELLARKLSRICLLGSLLCHEENAPALRRLLADRSEPAETEVIPAGFALVERDLILDAAVVRALPARQLYCTGRVQIEPDVDAAALHDALDGLQVKGLLLAPAPLQAAVAARCDLTSTPAAFYAGELWLVEGEEELAAARFAYLGGKATLVVLGRLALAADVEPQIIVARLDKVHNLGRITATPEQIAALQLRLGLKSGKLIDATAKPAAKVEAEGVVRIDNAGHLAL